MNNTEQRIAELQKQLDELQKQLDELKASLEKKDDGLWVPKNDDLYYYIGNAGSVFFDCFSSHALDKERLDFHNVFKTKEQAERHEKRLRLYNKLWKLAEHLNGDFEPIFGYGSGNKYTIQCSDGINITTISQIVAHFGMPVFKSKELAEKAISMLTDEEKEIFKNIYKP